MIKLYNIIDIITSILFMFQDKLNISATINILFSVQTEEICYFPVHQLFWNKLIMVIIEICTYTKYVSEYMCQIFTKACLHIDITRNEHLHKGSMI